MAELRVSELPTAVTLDDSDLLLLSQPDANSDTGYASAKTTNVALATKVVKQTNFSELQTTSKNVIGAINEISGAASSLVDLNDVDITTPSDGECLQYDGTSQKWKNKDILAVNETTLTEPYVYKQVPNGKYTEKLKKIIGASVVWNQLVDTNTTSVTITSGHKYIHWNGSTLTKATSDGTAISVTGGTDKIYDLTAMFGNDTVATAITTAKFAESFPDYANYAYSANTIQSVKVASKKVVGKNLFNGTDVLNAYIGTGPKILDNANAKLCYISCVPNTTYTVSKLAGQRFAIATCNEMPSNNVDVYNYTSNNTATRLTLTTDSYSKYIVAFIYNSNADSGTAQEMIDSVQIEFGNQATPYEPYHEETESLDHTEQRGLFKLDANNNLYADGDIYNADGSGEVKYDFRAYQSGDESLPNAITDGTNTVVKKATPTTATLTPFNELSALENGGTEEFIDYGVQQSTRDVAIPCGNESVYGDNKLMGEIIKYINN